MDETVPTLSVGFITQLTEPKTTRARVKKKDFKIGFQPPCAEPETEQ